jgi:hypothetical protein
LGCSTPRYLERRAAREEGVRVLAVEHQEIIFTKVPTVGVLTPTTLGL